jgi:hypothetical protein
LRIRLNAFRVGEAPIEPAPAGNVLAVAVHDGAGYPSLPHTRSACRYIECLIEIDRVNRYIDNMLKIFMRAGKTTRMNKAIR